ncbi:MAG TPA: hypothetical protein VKR79_04660 [Gaiellaceae bacterium]|nr:hypothetical protein [Gaiellaceae bacterium]
MRRAAILAVLALLVLGAAGTAWALNNPNPPSCTDLGDRLTKLKLIEQLSHAPHVLILGSSRARVAAPATVQKLTGRSAFNAGVRGGTASDEYVFTRVLAQQFPKAKTAYLIFTDVGIAGDGVNPEMADEPLARPFLGSDASSNTTTCVPNSYYLPDGGLAYPPGLSAAQRAQRVAKGVAQTLKSIPEESKDARPIDPAHTQYFQRTLAFMNAQGATPVIVLNPIYPTVLAAREKYGFPERKAAGVYLTWLRKHGYRFVLLDCENIKIWGGKASDFWNVDHVDRANMDRMLRYIAGHSHGALTR